MVWIADRVYTFTIARLLEGFLNIDKLTITAAGFGWDLIVGGVDQGITPAIHPGDIVGLSMSVKNTGLVADNFIIKTSGSAPVITETSAVIPLALGASTTYEPSNFTMPNADISYKIETFHESPY